MKQNIVILGIILLFSCTPSGGQDDERIENDNKYDQLLREMNISDNGPGGAVLVSKAAKILFQRAFGKANIELDVDMKLDHRIHIASVGKPFTAIAILKLMEDGKLSLQDDIRMYIKDFPQKEQPIRIEHLLTHTSGLPTNITNSYKELEVLYKNDYTMKEYISLIGKLPLLHAPGTRKRYSNPGYVILGSIIAEVSKMSYEQYLNQIMFAPLGMQSTILGDPEKVIKNRASGYTKQNNDFVNQQYSSKIFVSSGNGAYLSTVHDLNTWYNAVFNYEIINKKTLDLALTPYKLTDGTRISAGYVWPLNKYKDSIFVGHTGLTWGVASNVKYYPKEKILAVGILNCKSCAFENDYAFYKAIHRFRFIALENEFWTNKYPSIIDIKEYVGVYKSKSGKEIVLVSSYNDRLYQQMHDGDVVELFYLGDDYFFNQDNFEHIKFIINRKGIIESLESSQMETEVYIKQHE